MSHSLSNLPLDQLTPYVPDQIWLVLYRVHFFGMDIAARTTVIRLDDGSLFVHSPGNLTPELKRAIDGLGPVRFIVAPGTFHWLHVDEYRAAYPDAEVYVCPGIEERAPKLAFDHLLDDALVAPWSAEIEHLYVRGTGSMAEVAFFHRALGTLVLTDLIENVGNETVDVDWMMKFWWKAIFHMWNHPKPAPEYQMGYKDKAAVKASLERILAWDFRRIVVAHGDNVEENAKDVAREAWKRPLAFGA